MAKLMRYIATPSRKKQTFDPRITPSNPPPAGNPTVAEENNKKNEQKILKNPCSASTFYVSF